jgi:phosphoribosyl 1,2-cyclic phosphodiesterase
VLIDGGISRRETEKRLKRLGLSLGHIRAIFITHEHGDHIHGIAGISNKYNIPIYFTNATLQQSNVFLKDGVARIFKPYEEITVGSLLIKGFPKQHDACDPQSFVVSCDGVTVGVFTDIGYPCENMKKHFVQCHAAFLESNYDEAMLENGRYPWPLKNRIRGGYGHLSNRQALKFFQENRPHFMSHLFLAHLSRENNSPSLVEELFRKAAGKTKVIIAGRNQETELYRILDLNRNYTTKPVHSRVVLKKAQLSLF